jgi:hypothetical protein
MKYAVYYTIVGVKLKKKSFELTEVHVEIFCLTLGLRLEYFIAGNNA